jgi:hypothetical protein
VSDRLEEFRRQRGLLREHLAWLDNEIAALEGNPAPARPPEPPLVHAHAPAVELEAESILAEYRQPTMSIQKRTKFGCLLYFAAALVIMAVAITILYLNVKRAHGR